MPPSYRVTGNINVEVTLLTPPSLLPPSTTAAPSPTVVPPTTVASATTVPAPTAVPPITESSSITPTTKPPPKPSIWDRASELLWFVVRLAAVFVVTFVCIIAMAAVVDYFGIQDDFIWLFSAALLAASLLRFPPLKRDIEIDDLVVVLVTLGATYLVWYFLARDTHILMGIL